MTRVFRSLLALVAVVLTTSAAGAQTGYITGSVTDARSGAGLGGATIDVVSSTGARVSGATTNAEGTYRINGVPAGTYTVSARAVAHSPSQQTVTVIDGAPAIASFVLQPRQVELQPVTVTGDPGAGAGVKATDDMTPTHQIRYEDISTRVATSTTDHLLRTPGVDVVPHGIIGSAVVTRGFNNVFSGSLLTLTDYRFAQVPSLRVNVPYLNPTSSEDIARIEMVLGPASALYGPNSANGVMHIITRSPFESQGTTLTLDAGNRSVLRTAVRHAAAPSEKFGYKLSLERFTGNDWESVDSVELKAKLPDGTPAPVQRSFELEKYSGEARVDFRPRPGTELVATAGRGVAVSSIEPTGLGAAQVQDWTFDSYQLRGRQGRLFSQVFLNTSDAGDTFLLRNRNRADRGLIVDKSRQLVGQLQHGFGIGTVSEGVSSTVDPMAGELRSRLDFVYGLDYQWTNPRTEGTINGRYEDDDNISEIGGYVQARTRLSRLVDLIGAVRYDHHSRVEDPIISPRAGIIFHPTENQAVRLTYNRAFSPPSTNNLFLDLVAGGISFGQLGGFPVRTVGTPPGGLTFNRSCTGGLGGSDLCLRTPFPNGTGTVPVDVRPFYPYAVGIAAAGGRLAGALVTLAGLTEAEANSVVQRISTLNPAADNAAIPTRLRVLNPTTSQFADAPAELRDIAAIEPTITNSYEIGYKGFIANRFSLTVDVWRQRRENFVGPLTVETPSAFLDAAGLGAYVGPRIAVQLAGDTAKIRRAATVIAGALGGVANNAATGIPLGVVALNENISGPTDILLAYRNFGTVDLTGADLGGEFRVTDFVTVGGTYSWADKDYFRDVEGDQDIALNAPAGKGSVTATYSTMNRDANSGGLRAQLSNRWVKSFPALSGVYICNAVTDACPEGKVPSYSVLDAQVSFKPQLFPNAMIAITGTNLLNKEYQSFPGAARIGRLIMSRVQYTF